jgi:hypothetical protein
VRAAILLLVSLAAACGSGDDDAAPAADAASSAIDAAGMDAANTDGVVLLTYRDGSAELPLAYLGYQRSGDTITELYVELSNMEEPGCPSADSPIPDQLMTVSGFAGADPATRTFDDGVRVSFFDFAGTLRDEIEPAAATAATVTVTAHDEGAGTAEATVNVTFGDDGSAVGSLVATHCDSLDTTE